MIVSNGSSCFSLVKWHLYLLHKLPLEYIFASCCAVWAAHTDIKHLFSPYPHKKRFIQFGMDFEGCFHSCLQNAAATAAMLELRQNITEVGKTPYRQQHYRLRYKMNWVSVSIVRAQGAWVFSNRIWTFIQNRFCVYVGLCSLDFHLEDDILHSQSKNIYGYGYQS